eukprot:jgi/Tetstr1/454920/TSEL_041783.t1
MAGKHFDRQFQLKQAASTQSAGSRESGLDDLDVIARRLMGEVEIKDRTWLFKTYKRCFLGTDLVKAMVKLQIAPDVKGAVAVGNQLMERRVFHHVWEAGFEFKNSTLFYRFSFHEELLGGTDLTNISQTYVLDTCKRAKGNVEMVEYKSGKFAFQGKALVDWMLKEGTVLTQEEAMKLANLFVACKLITKVVSDKGPMQAFSLSCLYVLTIKPSEGDKAKANSALGVLRLEYGYPPIPGDIDHPNSFPYKPSATWSGLGVFGITGDCGFMANYQRFVSETTSVKPVFMSSLCLIPSIMAGLKADAKLVVVTANSDSLAAIFPNRYDLPLPEEEFHKCSDVTGFEVVAEATSLLSPDVDRVLVGNEIAKRVVDFLEIDSTVQAILLECTELPHFSAPLLRHYTQLPVFDALSVCDFFQDASDSGEGQAGRRAACVGQHCQRGLPDTLIN